MSNCLLYLLVLCCCCDHGHSDLSGCGYDSRVKRQSCCDTKQPPRPRCVMPADEKFICKADNEGAFLDEKECE